MTDIPFGSLASYLIRSIWNDIDTQLQENGFPGAASKQYRWETPPRIVFRPFPRIEQIYITYLLSANEAKEVVAKSNFGQTKGTWTNPFSGKSYPVDLQTMSIEITIFR